MSLYGSKTREEFQTALRLFVKGCNQIRTDYYAKQGFMFDPDPLEIQPLQKRARLVTKGSAFCFVDYATGDVLKCDGWKRPAKTARGNIYAADNGLGTMGPYGPAYLR